MKSKSNLLVTLGLNGFALILVSSAPAATYNWVGGLSGIWDTVGTNTVWNDGASNVPWAQTDATTGLHNAVFGGASGTYSINVAAAVAATRLVFSTSGYTLSSSAARTITITGSPVVQVDTLVEATIGANVTINATNSMTVGQGTAAMAAGTLNIDGTGAVLRVTNAVPSLSFNGDGLIVNLKNGTIRNNTAANTTGAVIIASGAGSSATMNVSGGTLAVTGSNGLILGGMGQGILTHTGGSVTINATHTVVTGGLNTVGLTLGNNAANAEDNTYNLDGGTLTAPTVRKGAGTGQNVFNFNGGLLVASNGAAHTSNATYMEGLSAANVKAGGARIQVTTAATEVTINQALLEDSSSTGGGLAKTGAGTLTLGGANTYTGNTTISAGTLSLGATNVLPDGSAVVLNGGTLMTGNTFSETAKSLILTAASTITMGLDAGTSVLTFTDGLAGTSGISPSRVLSIWNWNGSLSGGVDDQLFLPVGSLNTTELAGINFYTGAGTGLINGGGAQQLGSGELVPVPEPGALASACAVAGVALFRGRRQA